MRIVLSALVPLLAGCALVVVRPEGGGTPRISAFPLGVRVDRGSAAAVSVSTVTLGVSTGCFVAGAGLSRIDCDVIDAEACSVALVHAPAADPTLLEELAAASRARCPQTRNSR